MKRHSFPKDRLKIVLLEGIHPSAAEAFADAGYQAEIEPSALSEAELLERIPEIHLLGIRSKTQVTRAVLEASPRLIALGCFCIGTNQVDLEAAAATGVPVFNAPFSNTRSVAELTMAEVVMLARKAGHRSMQLHQGRWEKSARGCHEVRHRTLGVVGYGHIGPQVGLLAEAFGMQVLFYDVNRKLPLGNARPVATLDELLDLSDFVSLHVPETPETRGMIGAAQLARMQRGSYLLNLSRGSVVDLDALRAAIESGHIAGAGVDVFPEEPRSNEEPFEGVLRGLENVILTPHVGGSTLEAQRGIGLEVAQAMITFTDTGSSRGAVNFPEVDLPLQRDSHRILNMHRNVPGVLRDINSIIAAMDANVRSQYLGTQGDIGYLIMDVDPGLSRQVKRNIDALAANVRTRLLF